MGSYVIDSGMNCVGSYVIDSGMNIFDVFSDIVRLSRKMIF